MGHGDVASMKQVALIAGTPTAGRTASRTIRQDNDDLRTPDRSVRPIAWPAWVQRCGIDSRCGCPSHERAAGIARDLQMITSAAASPLSARTGARTLDGNPGIASGREVPGAEAGALPAALHAHANAGDGGLQPELVINQPGDVYEQEADQMADRVVSTTPVGGQPRKCSACTGEATNCRNCGESQHQVQSKAIPGYAVAPSPGLVPPIGDPQGAGQSLTPSIRARFESRFERDFSAVRVHTDNQAGESA